MTPDRLIKWRKAQGLSQIELAGLLGVHPLTVSAWERKVQQIPPFLHLALEALENREAKKPKAKGK